MATVQKEIVRSRAERPQSAGSAPSFRWRMRFNWISCIACLRRCSTVDCSIPSTPASNHAMRPASLPSPNPAECCTCCASATRHPSTFPTPSASRTCDGHSVEITAGRSSRSYRSALRRDFTTVARPHGSRQSNGSQWPPCDRPPCTSNALRGPPPRRYFTQLQLCSDGRWNSTLHAMTVSTLSVAQIAHLSPDRHVSGRTAISGRKGVTECA